MKLVEGENGEVVDLKLEEVENVMYNEKKYNYCVDVQE